MTVGTTGPISASRLCLSMFPCHPDIHTHFLSVNYFPPHCHLSQYGGTRYEGCTDWLWCYWLIHDQIPSSDQESSEQASKLGRDTQITIPIDKLNPRFWSSRYSWHSEHDSQQQWTQQSPHGFSSREYWALSLVRYKHEYMHEHPNAHSISAYSDPLTPQAAVCCCCFFFFKLWSWDEERNVPRTFSRIQFKKSGNFNRTYI